MVDPVCCVFDLDDTLYPERDYARSALQWLGGAIVREFGIAGAAQALIAGFEAGHRDAIGIFWAAHDLPDAARAPLIAAMQAHRPMIALSPGAAMLLAAMRTRALPFAIVTDGRSVTQRAKLTSLGCDDAAYVSISEECGIAKTDPERLRPIIQQLTGYQFLMIGDNPAKDFVAANRLGWRTVMLRDRGENIHDQRIVPSPEHAAGAVVDDLRELIGCFYEPA